MLLRVVGRGGRGSFNVLQLILNEVLQEEVIDFLGVVEGLGSEARLSDRVENQVFYDRMAEGGEVLVRRRDGLIIIYETLVLFFLIQTLNDRSEIYLRPKSL